MNRAEAASFLGVPPDASEARVKEAYKKKAKQLHPDRPGGNKEAF